MPPTWSILAFFAITFGLPVLPLAIGGAFAASAGRLALASRRGGRRFLSDRSRDNLGALGDWIDTKGKVAAPLAMLPYSFGPSPRTSCSLLDSRPPTSYRSSGRSWPGACSATRSG